MTPFHQLPPSGRMLAAIVLWACVAMLGACSASSNSIPRVVLLFTGPPGVWELKGEPGGALERFRDGLREHGYIEGTTIALELRGIGNSPEQMAQQVAEILRQPVDVIVAAHTGVARVVMNATRTVPIVMAVTADPVADGLVKSLAHPGGNVTGLSIMTDDVAGKRLELLKQAIPGLTRVGIMLDAGFVRWEADFRQNQAAARALGLELVPLKVRGPDDFAGAFTAAREGGAGAVILMQSFMLGTNGKLLAELALAKRMPTMFGTGERTFARAGGLMNYGASIPESWYGAATYVHKILRGAKPADLPVQQPKDFEFIVNRQTADILGVTLPPALLLQAKEVIR